MKIIPWSSMKPRWRLKALFPASEGMLTLVLCCFATVAVFSLMMYPMKRYLTIQRRISGGDSASDINSTTRCSMEVFTNYYRRRNYFPGEGNWLNHSTIDSTAFEPNICRFRHQRLPFLYLDRCLKQRNMSSIVTMGDSNGSRYYDAILKLLQDGGHRCLMILEEKVDRAILKPDLGYYSRVEPRVTGFLRASYRHCHSCASKSHRCTSAESHNLSLEHLAMVSVLDSSLRLEINHNHHVINLRFRADTYQEYLLKYHLKRHVPDLLLIFPPFNHDQLTESVLSLESRLRYFVALLKVHLPTVKLVWVPAFREFENKKSRVWANRTSYGMTATRKIDEFNKVLFRVIANDLLRQNSQVFGFFDMVKASEGLDGWSWDGIHMHEVWYEKMMLYLAQTFCSD